MTKKPLQNIPASIKARLLQLAKQRGEDFNYLLGRYAAFSPFIQAGSICVQTAIADRPQDNLAFLIGDDADRVQAQDPLQIYRSSLCVDLSF